MSRLCSGGLMMSTYGPVSLAFHPRLPHVPSPVTLAQHPGQRPTNGRVPVVADPVFRAKAEAWMAAPVQFPWDTSIMKVVDNLVIGAGKTRGALL